MHFAIGHSRSFIHFCIMKGKFALTLTSHRILGPLLNPVIINISANREYYTVADRLSQANLKQYESNLQPEEIKLVNIIEEYSDTQLLQVFSKKKTSAQDFLASIGEPVFEMQVRPYIERRVLRCIELLSGTEIPVYLKKQHNNIYNTDKLLLQEDIANVVFNFVRNQDGVKYFLTIRYNDEDISLTGRNGFILVNDPCCMVLENRIFQFDDIDGKKLLPFFKKKSIIVKKETERKFLKTFAQTVIQKYKVNASGITIADLHLKPQPILSIEPQFSGIPVFMLKFRYGDRNEYYAGKKSELLVTFEENNDMIEFRRLNRDMFFENQVISSLLEMGLANVDSSSFVPLRLKKAQNILVTYELVNWLNFNSAALKKAGIDVIHSNPVHPYYIEKVELKIKISENKNDWFDIYAVVVLETFEIPFIKFRSAIIEGKREFELPDGRIIVLPEEWFARFRDLFSFARDDGGQLQLDKQHFPLLKESLQGIEGSYAEKVRKWIDSTSFEDRLVPVEIIADLRDYQKKGFSWMCKLYLNDFGGCLADDMGLGKTLQTLTLIQQVINEERKKQCGPASSKFDRQLTIFDSVDAASVKAKPSLIVVPSTLVHNWINEAKRFAPELKTGIYGGQGRKPFNFYYDNYELIITSYGMVRNDIDVMKCFEFLYLILDESQVIKNAHSKTYKSILNLNSSHRLVLTGTPIENSLTDLWAQMNFLNPGLLGSSEFFRNQFVIPIEKSNDEKQSHILQALIRPFILRRTKSEVARELPPVTEQVIYCDMSESQQAFYETEKSKARNLILDNIKNHGIGKSSFVILQSLTKLRQVANHPFLTDENYNEDSGKHEVILDNIRNIVAEGHKALVFSSFVKHLDLYTNFCSREGFKYAWLTGDVPQTQREGIIRKFQEEENVHLFFISIKAGGFGLNLTSADYVFILDPWWNPAVEEQAMSRAHRMGQKKKVFVYRFIAKDTVEEKIHVLQERKSQLADNFINNNNPFNNNDRDELMKLLE
jgi:superfamily II DNA or RNA helicase